MLLLTGTWYVVSLTVVFTYHLVYYYFGEISAVNFHCVHSEYKQRLLGMFNLFDLLSPNNVLYSQLLILIYFAS